MGDERSEPGGRPVQVVPAAFVGARIDRPNAAEHLVEIDVEVPGEGGDRIVHGVCRPIGSRQSGRAPGCASPPL